MITLRIGLKHFILIPLKKNEKNYKTFIYNTS